MKEALKKRHSNMHGINSKPAPRILTSLVKLMKPGSIIYNLAAEQGGNSAFQAGKISSIDE